MGAEIFPVKAFLNCSIIPAQCAVARVILTKGNSPEIIKIHLIRSQIAMSGNIGMAVSAGLCGRRGHVMLEWLVQEMVRTNLFSGRHDPPLSGLRPTLTLPCFPAQHTSSHYWSKSRANTLQYKLQTLQLQKLKICCILLRSNKAALLPSIWLIRFDVIFRHVRIVSSVEWVHLSPHSCWSLPRNGLWLLTNAIYYARLNNGSNFKEINNLKFSGSVRSDRRPHAEGHRLSREVWTLRGRQEQDRGRIRIKTEVRESEGTPWWLEIVFYSFTASHPRGQ